MREHPRRTTVRGKEMNAGAARSALADQSRGRDSNVATVRRPRELAVGMADGVIGDGDRKFDSVFVLRHRGASSRTLVRPIGRTITHERRTAGHRATSLD